VTRTFDFNSCKPLLPIGYFANVIDLRPIGFSVGIAFSTDGVGTKLLIAEMMHKYDTVGIDCVAMNVNDILCVGATPISMVDYIAINQADPSVLEEISRGLFRGCEMAQVNLPGGEIAQVAELLAKKEGQISFDIVGTAIGTVNVDKIIVGQNLNEGDRLVGLQSNGLHSNGYTLARKICFELAKLSADTYMDEFGKTLGEELLLPTRIYVREILEILKKVEVKGIFHITGDGLFNIARTERAVGYRIESFPEPPPIFQFLQRTGNISWSEMFRVFNMGIGFVLAIPDDSSSFDTIQKIAKKGGYDAFQLGHVVEDPHRTIHLEPYQLVSRSGAFQSQ
jgi:phosphoribosylformylglycinamidine cyclo-ligase